MSALPAPPDDVLAAYGLAGAMIAPITDGLINQTWRVTPRTGEPRIVQRLNPIFGAAVHDDIAAITAQLRAHDVPVPTLVPTTGGEAYVEHDTGVFRALPLLAGATIHTLARPEQAFSAGALVGRFHAALDGFEHAFAFTRPGPHDTPRHLAFLEATLDQHVAHPRYDVIAPLAARVLGAGSALPAMPDIPVRVIHGDLKITNLLFEGDEAVAILDLDTLQHETMGAEMGDALRSWTNPAGEEQPGAVDVGLFAAAVKGFASTARDLLSDDELRAFVIGLERISLELSARFCADALNESYFGWKSDRYESRSHHNEQRARSQLALSESVGLTRDLLFDIAMATFGRA